MERMTPRQIFAWQTYVRRSNSRQRLESYEVVSVGNHGNKQQREKFVKALDVDRD